MKWASTLPLFLSFVRFAALCLLSAELSKSGKPKSRRAFCCALSSVGRTLSNVLQLESTPTNSNEAIPNANNFIINNTLDNDLNKKELWLQRYASPNTLSIFFNINKNLFSFFSTDDLCMPV
jgi:hypothetical protein